MTSRSGSISPSTPDSLSPAEKHRRAQWAARFAYVAVMFIFLSICAIAVTSTMQHEREKDGFHAIRVKKPISFFDYTYVDKSGKPKPADKPAP
jgi:hypothetical protein